MLKDLTARSLLKLDISYINANVKLLVSHTMKIRRRFLLVSPGGHDNVFHVFRKGVEEAEKLVPDWDYLVKVDADCILPPTYVSSLLRHMETDARLGIASGIPLTKTEYGYKRPQHLKWPTDGARIFRRKCWNDIGGIYPIYAFDIHAVLEANRLGWKTRAFEEITRKEERFAGGRMSRFSIARGLAIYAVGYPLPYVICDTLVRIRRKRSLLEAMVLFFPLRSIIRLLGIGPPLQNIINSSGSARSMNSKQDCLNYSVILESKMNVSIF